MVKKSSGVGVVDHVLQARTTDSARNHGHRVCLIMSTQERLSNQQSLLRKLIALLIWRMVAPGPSGIC